jgi:hypothetical protein
VSRPITGSAIAASRLCTPFHWFAGRARPSEPIDAPVDFQIVPIRIAELDRDLHARAAPARVSALT